MIGWLPWDRPIIMDRRMAFVFITMPQAARATSLPYTDLAP